MTAFGKRKKDPEAEEPRGDTDTAVSEGEASGEPSADGEPAEELDELERALQERDEAKDLALRAQADFQNLRRRTQSDIDAAVNRAKADVLSEAVTVLDYLDMALAAPVESEDAKNLKIGIEMTRAQLQALFDRLSIRPIDATGTFDPAVHQAVSTVETDEHEPGVIVEVVRGGWMMGETVLRFAQVKVAAEPEAADVEAEVIEDEDDGEAPGDTEAPADED